VACPAPLRPPLLHLGHCAESPIEPVDRGEKHLCPQCQTRFYDLKRPKVVCPRCGADPLVAAALAAASKKKKRASPKPVAVQPQASASDDDDSANEEPASEEGVEEADSDEDDPELEEDEP
jgi:uncharacterized protein (TIGR02300 family)